MGIATLRHALKGQTTVETYHRGSEDHNEDDKTDGDNNDSEVDEDDEDDADVRYLCIPSACERRVYKVLPSENLYDFGWKENLRQFFAQEVFPDQAQ